MYNIKYCKKCGKAFDIAINFDYCLECRYKKKKKEEFKKCRVKKL